jgi:Aerobic-type carbon monoxide dehydrogenase, large subunit CoxL/CutL homologs
MDRRSQRILHVGCARRDHVSHAELAMDKDGKFLALRVSTIANMGAYLSTFAPCVPTYLYGTLLAGVYATPAIYVEVKAVFTNTVAVDAYRGAGRPEATFLLERLVDKAAREMKMDRLDIRRKNFIPANAFPYQTPVALQYDSGDYQSTLAIAEKKADVAGFEKRRAEAKSRGMLRGIGFSTYLEACGIAPSAVVGSLGARAGLYESASVRVHPTGSVTMFTGTHSHGQGHETTFAQIVSSTLGMPIESIEVVHGDTNKIPFGMGTYGSRSLAVGGSALVKALDKITTKAKRIAAHLMEANVADVEFKDGVFTVAGTDKSIPFGQVRSPPMCRTTIPSRSSSPAWRRRRSTTRSTSPIPAAVISASWRSIRKPASPSSSTSRQWTISAGSSIP